MAQLKTLIVDDELELRQSVAAVLKHQIQPLLTGFEFEIAQAEDGLSALQIIKEQSIDLVLMDVKMPKMDGLEALKKIKEHDPRIFVVIMTAHSNLNDAITAIKEGAYDYLEKPVQPNTLQQIVERTIEARELISNLALSNPVFDDDVDSDFVGNTQKMRDVFSLIYKLCKVETTVLIRGENGTGKELVARAIHSNSHRKNGPFIAINCGAIPETLIESELFGHEKGAFTGAIERKIGKFQAANNGTLFLDEIGELKPDMQVKLLRVLQEKKFTPIGSHREVKTGARIIAATNRNLEKMMTDGTFREDLFYRLNVMPIFMPPLRDRIDDIHPLVQYFIKQFSKRHQRDIQSIEPAALNLLKLHSWPGNIRELENAIERAFVVENTQSIHISSLPEAIQNLATKSGNTGSNAIHGQQTPPSPNSNHNHTEQDSMSSNNHVSNMGPYSGPLDFDLFKEEMEKEFIISALKANHGRINQTVAHANIPKNTLLRKIRKYGINVKEYLDE